MRADVASLAYRGRTASIGFARGPFIRLNDGEDSARIAGSPDEETSALREAIQSASEQIAELAAAAGGGEAAQILEFQVALLEDEDFITPIFVAVDEGSPADKAWSSALDEQIADYTAASDEYLQARSSDLADLRDRVLRILRGGEKHALRIPSGAVVCADDLPPSRFLEIDWSSGGGLALLRGSPTSHVAMLARARAIPMVVQLGAVRDAASALLDGESATLELDPGTEEIAQFERRREIHRKSRASARAILRRPAATWRGERIRLLINIQRVEDLDHADAQYADGVGLMRTEFLLSGPDGVPGEETQFQAYDAVLRWADKRPVTIRTFDAGGDKPVKGFTPEGEANPFLGLRGLRLCLARPELFKVQLRALARAAVRGNLKVMFPMVTVAAELEAARELFAQVVADLQGEGIGAMLPELGIMVEVPAAAMAIGDFKAAFFSIGSNDLAQYVLACDRSNGALGNLSDPLHPAVLELIARTAEHARRSGAAASLCGDMASDPGCVPALLQCGLRELSVNPPALAQIKQTIDRLSHGGASG